MSYIKECKQCHSKDCDAVSRRSLICKKCASENKANAKHICKTCLSTKSITEFFRGNNQCKTCMATKKCPQCGLIKEHGHYKKVCLDCEKANEEEGLDFCMTCMKPVVVEAFDNNRKQCKKCRIINNKRTSDKYTNITDLVADTYSFMFPQDKKFKSTLEKLELINQKVKWVFNKIDEAGQIVDTMNKGGFNCL